MSHAMFTPVSTNEGPAVAVQLPHPYPELLQLLLAHTLDADSAPVSAGPLASAGADDLFATLEAEMAADRLAAAQERRRSDAADLTAAVLSATGPDGVRVLVPAESAQALFETLNRIYVAQRRAELALADVPVQVGQAESAEGLLGLDALLPDAADPSEAEDGPSTTLVTMVLAALVGMLLDALTNLDDRD